MKPDTVHAAFQRSAAAQPQAPFLFVESVTAAGYDIPAGTLSYGDAAAQVESLRSRYAAAGYGPGHRVGLMLANRPENNASQASDATPSAGSSAQALE